LTALDLQTPSTVELVELAFVDAVAEVVGIREALDHEPEQLPARPCVTMLYVHVEQTDVFTGPSTDNWWEWRVNVYVDLGGGASYRDGQLLLKRLVPLVLRTVRVDQRLADTCIRAEFNDVDDEPTFDHDAGLIWKSLRLRALLEET
jgi:hypothetical protein